MTSTRQVLESLLARRAVVLRGPLHAEAGDAISFDSGYAFPETLPDMTRAAQRALGEHRAESLQYGPAFGLPELRDWIAQYMRDDGVSGVGAEDVLVVNGAKHGLELICRLFAEEGDCVVVTAPTYFSAIPILRSFGLSFIEIPQDGEGIDVDALGARLDEHRRRGARAPKFIYNVSDFHNPTGVTMSQHRRIRLITLAESHGIPLVEDSPYRRLRYEGVSEPSLKALDGTGIVFALGTFSKLLGPGLRVGWVSGLRPMLARMARLKSDGGTCPLTQRTILEFFSDGGLEPHLERIRAEYARHRDRMAAAVRARLPSVAFTMPQGGYYLWLEFPEGTDTNRLAARAHREGVSVIAGSVFFAGSEDGAIGDRHAPHRFVRLAYSRATPSEIDRGVECLARAYHAVG